MKQFDENFRTKLYETIQDIESNSLVEIVTIIKARSDNYKDVALWIAFAFMAMVYSFFMFSPINFDVFLIYFFTLISFPLGYSLSIVIEPIKRIFISKNRMNKLVEIKARAIFQKGGIYHTIHKTGILFYCSVFEKMVYIIPDRGAATSVPQSEWEQMQKNFNQIFLQSNHADALLSELKKCKPVFNQFVPPVENDINELPDNLDVNL